MKVLSDFSVIIKLVLTCLAIGFVLGLCASGSAGWSSIMPSHGPARPDSTPSGPSRR